MAKLSTFFRRLFTSFNADDDCSSTTDSGKRISTIVPKIESYSVRSCTSSPAPGVRSITKQTTMPNSNNIITTNHHGNGVPNSNFLSSNTNKLANRRLSAPLIIHASTTQHRQQRSALADENMKETLIHPLQRLSLSSTTGSAVCHNNSVSSLGTSGGSASTSPHNDIHTSSRNLSPSNSINIPPSLNNIPLATGTPLAQFPVGPSSSSPRVSIQSNNSSSPNTERRMSTQGRGRRPSMFDPIDPKELQQALYASAIAKGTTPSNLTNEDEFNRTLSRLTISYDRDSEHVSFDALSFENLQYIDGFHDNTSDTILFYCRIRLLPEKRSLHQTKIVRLTRSQTLYSFDKKQLNEFELSYEQLNHHSIEIFLYKINTIRSLFKDIRLASVKYDLNQLYESDRIYMKKLLDKCDSLSINQDPDLGEILISLSYLQSAAKLSVVVLEAKHLRPLSNETKAYPDACVKVTLYDRNGKKLKRKKTSVQRTSDCPIFNEELVFELRRDLAAEVTIEIRLVHESLSYKEQLGSIIFGPIISNTTKGAVSPENIYWSTILSGESLNAQWQILKPTIKIEDSK